jgi:hypothetical protein
MRNGSLFIGSGLSGGTMRRFAVLAVVTVLSLGLTSSVADAKATQTDSQWWAQHGFTVALVVTNVSTLGTKVEARTWTTVEFIAGEIADECSALGLRQQPLPGFKEWKAYLTAVAHYEVAARASAKARMVTTVTLSATVNKVLSDLTALYAFMKAHNLRLPS